MDIPSILNQIGTGNKFDVSGNFNWSNRELKWLSRQMHYASDLSKSRLNGHLPIYKIYSIGANRMAAQQSIDDIARLGGLLAERPRLAVMVPFRQPLNIQFLVAPRELFFLLVAKMQT
jgi:hypothetical protein